MGTILEILTTNYDGQIADITFYPCSGGSIRIGDVILPYEYETEDYYGTYDIYLPNYNKNCLLNIPCLSPTPTPTPTITPTMTQTKTPTPTPTHTSSGLVLELYGCCDLSTQYVSYNPILTYPGVYTATNDLPYQVVTGIPIVGIPTRIIVDITNYNDCTTWLTYFGGCP
jgi:hypothetical protein